MKEITTKARMKVGGVTGSRKEVNQQQRGAVMPKKFFVIAVSLLIIGTLSAQGWVYGTGAGGTEEPVWSLDGDPSTNPAGATVCNLCDPDETHFLGTTDDRPLHIGVNCQRALRIEPAEWAGTYGFSPNIIGGYCGNYVRSGLVGVTISGGGNTPEIYGPNVVKGSGHFGTIGGGTDNWITQEWATISGGFVNRAEGDYSVIGGGTHNKVFDNRGTIGGGGNNTIGVSTRTAIESYSVIGGGRGNTVANDGYCATIAGGYGNEAASAGAVIGGGGVGWDSENKKYVPLPNKIESEALSATIGGGADNTIKTSTSALDPKLPAFATIGGGHSNTATDTAATVSGGATNTVYAACATIGGGGENCVAATARNATIGGGWKNRVDGHGGVIAGGRVDTVWSNWATIGGGRLNMVGLGSNPTIGEYATIGGGYGNRVDGWGGTISGGGVTKELYNGHWVASPNPNKIEGGLCATISGGAGNTIKQPTYGIEPYTDFFATISGGSTNTVSGKYATIGGGYSNTASGDTSTVSGGAGNVASGFASAIGGGGGNKATELATTVAGGASNTAEGWFATIGGGYHNTASENSATVGGGRINEAAGKCATVGGGYKNTASGDTATVSGGATNTASGRYATVAGGGHNKAIGDYATVGGGGWNLEAIGLGATIPGGLSNSAQGACSFAAGHHAKAIHDGAFVWGANSGSDFKSTGPNQFSVLAYGTKEIPSSNFPVVRFYTDYGCENGVQLLEGENCWKPINPTVNCGGAADDDWLPQGASNSDDIYHDGNVGIGTDAPGANLHVKNSGGPVNLRLESACDYSSEVSFYECGSGPMAKVRWSPDYNALMLETSGNPVKHILLMPRNNVGIGTTDPKRKLHVKDVMRLEPRSGEPLNPSMGDIYMNNGANTSDGHPRLMVYDGTDWKECW